MKNKGILLSAIVAVALTGGAVQAAGKAHNKFMHMFDSNNDGKVTEAEFNAASTEHFKRMDADGNGSVNMDEFKNYVQHRRVERREHKLARIDSNHDGVISKDEFIAYKMKRVEKGFNRLDANHDGKVSKEEFVNGKGKSKGKKHRRGCFSKARIFKRLDANHDGKITQQESHAKWSGWFMKLDANGDKVVTADEIDKARQQRHQ